MRPGRGWHSSVCVVKPVQAKVDWVIDRLEKCCHDIRTWMRSNFLKLNDGKTEVLLIGSRQQFSKIALPGVTGWPDVDRPCYSGQGLGCSVWHAHDHGPPRKHPISLYLSLPATISETLATSGDSLTATREDCPCLCYVALGPDNALLACLSDDTVTKLQNYQNIAVRVVTRTRIRDHIKPLLVNLHWLPVEQMIQYKLTHRCVQGTKRTCS